jgi:preprotein translocase subunit SecF
MKLLKLVPDDTNIDFLKWRVMAFALSLVLMAASVGLVATKGLNFGVDFIGGQMIRATFTQSTEAPNCEARLQRLAMANRRSSASARKIRCLSA